MYILDPTNPVIALCLQGTRAEFDHRPADARRLYEQAWQAAGNDFEAAIAAHYRARFPDDQQDRLYWNQEALRRALAVPDQAQVAAFYGSLYLCLGESYEALGDAGRASQYYDLASRYGATHVPDPPA